MKPPQLAPDEYIIEDPVPRYGPFQGLVIKSIGGPLTLVATLLICYWGPRLYSQFHTNPALRDEPIYRIASYVYIPLIVVFVGLLLHQFVSIYRTKIMLTNKAILRRNVFSTDRIPFAEIVSAKASYKRVNFNQKAQVNSFFIGLFLGLNWELTVNDGELNIQDMSKRCAKSLEAKLEAARSTTQHQTT